MTPVRTTAFQAPTYVNDDARAVQSRTISVQYRYRRRRLCAYFTFSRQPMHREAQCRCKQYFTESRTHAIIRAPTFADACVCASECAYFVRASSSRYREKSGKFFYPAPDRRRATRRNSSGAVRAGIRIRSDSFVEHGECKHKFKVSDARAPVSSSRGVCVVPTTDGRFIVTIINIALYARPATPR